MQSIFYSISISFHLNGALSVLIHPLGRNEVEDHCQHPMWLGQSYPLDVSNLNREGGDEPQYPELKLGYSTSTNS